MYLEQCALDVGRHQVGWLFTGLPQPAFNLTTANTSRNQEEPFGLLMDPAWLHANLSYLKDLDYFDQRQASIAKTRIPGSQSGQAPTAPPAATRPRGKVKARKKPVPAAQPQGGPQ